MHNIRIMKTKKCDVSSYGLLLIHPSFGHKIDPQQDNNPREKNFHFGIICEGENILQWKCWRWKMWETLVVGGVVSSHWSATLSFNTDVLMNVLFGDLHPYDPGCSCGVTLCIGSQTHRETEEPFRCQPFNLFCKQSSWNKAGCW